MLIAIKTRAKKSTICIYAVKRGRVIQWNLPIPCNPPPKIHPGQCEMFVFSLGVNIYEVEINSEVSFKRWIPLYACKMPKLDLPLTVSGEADVIVFPY